jgi:hypothetical protein
VIPQKRFEADFIPDFVIGVRHSGGYRWTLVELESPATKMFRKDGKSLAALRDALDQLRDWRAWLTRNRDYAARSREDHGLGLTDISPNSSGLVLIGRERDLDPADNPRRQRLEEDNQIELHSYDWLVRQARGRVKALERSKASHEDN